MANNISIQAANAVIWIETLLETTEKQTTGRLGAPDTGYCCLGIGCKILEVPASPHAAVSSSFCGKVGLYDRQGLSVNTDDFSRSLVGMNDKLKYSFAKIGRVLATEPEAYFRTSVANKIKSVFKSDPRIKHNEKEL